MKGIEPERKARNLEESPCVPAHCVDFLKFCRFLFALGILFMKLLVVGSGGREHAIAKKLLASPQVEQVFVAPGNDGMTLDGLDVVNIGISEHSKLIDFAKENDIAWSFIGPDDALAAGIVDDFNQAGLKAFGPTKLAAELEWSKDFAKEIMVKYGVPTAAYGTFSDFEEAGMCFC